MAKPSLIYISLLIVLGILLALTGHSHESAQSDQATYVGQQTCMSSGCHADYRNSIYQGAEEFQQTMHATVHKVPSAESVVIDRWFRADTVLRFYDSRLAGSSGDSILLQLRYNPVDSIYAVKLKTTGVKPDSTDWLNIIWTFGGNGWLQRYIVELDGSRYVLPFQYVLPRYRDRSESGTFRFLDVDNWFRYDSTSGHLRLRTFHDQTFVNGSWDNACVGCHVGSFHLEEKEIPDQPLRWIATWPGDTDPALQESNASIGCESCHGPGSLHVADPDNRDIHHIISPKFWDRTASSRLWTDRKLDLCNQCHNRHHSTEDLHFFAYDDARGLLFQPGEDLSNFIRDPLADGRYWGDGVSSRAHHQTGHDYVRSKHYTKHVFINGCYDCHNVHNNTDQPYMLSRDWYSLQKGEGCTSTGCHSAFAKTETRNGAKYNLHTAHRQEHSQCVNCHYTKVASFGEAGHYEFSDHSDQVLSPRATIEFRNNSPEGMPNTCALSCHRNGYGDRNRPDAFFDVIEGEAMRAPDFGVVDTNLMIWNEPTDIELADSLWNGFKRLYPQFVSGVRTGDATYGSVAKIVSISPNPARDHATVRFILPEASNVRITIYDVRGKVIRTLADAHHQAGSYTLHWNRADETHRLVQAGIYFVQLEGKGISDGVTVVVVN